MAAAREADACRAGARPPHCALPCALLFCPAGGDVADGEILGDDDDEVPENDDARALSPDDKARRAYLAKLLSIRRKPSDEELRKIRGVFPLIYRAHVKRLWKRLCRRGLSKDEATDLIQDTFEDAFKE